MDEIKKLILPSAIAVLVVVALGAFILLSQGQKDTKDVSGLPESQSNISPDSTPAPQSVVDKVLTSLGVKRGSSPGSTPAPTPVYDLSKGGLIEGTINLFIGPPIESTDVCAKNIITRAAVCVKPTASGENQGNYQIGVPAGKYIIYASSMDGDRVGIYNDYVKCGMQEGCSREPLELEIAVGQVESGINPNDWYSAGTIP